MLFAGCDGGEVRAIVPDTGIVDAPVDAAPGCSFPDHYDIGHDEDGDGVADDCDLCPLVPDHEQIARRGSPGYTATSPWCRSNASLEAPNRLFFEPFTSQFLDSSRWVSLSANDGPYPTDPPHDERAIGVHDFKPRLLVTQLGTAAGSAIVATGILTAISGAEADQITGIVVRYQEDSRRFYGCFMSGANVFLAWVPDGCTATACNLVKVSAELPRPAYSVGSKGRLGMRVSISAGVADGTLECRLYDPSDPANALTAFAAVAALTAKFERFNWLAAGELGFFSTRVTARWSGLDVLTSKK
jgi:hypothetical protein